jgi:hypothetical protein
MVINFTTHEINWDIHKLTWKFMLKNNQKTKKEKQRVMIFYKFKKM